MIKLKTLLTEIEGYDSSIINEGQRINYLNKEINRLTTIYTKISYSPNATTERSHFIQSQLLKRIEKLKKELNRWEDLYKVVNEDISNQSPAIHSTITNQISQDFINYIKSVENGIKKGFVNGKWHIYSDPTGLNIGYGHKIEKGEEKYFQNGISNTDVENLLRKDLLKSKYRVYRDIESMFHVKIPLDKTQKEMLTDFAFNLGTLQQFPKFVKAVLNKDWNTAKQEYKRSYKDINGISHEMSRNKYFYDRYLNKSTIKEIQGCDSLLEKSGLVKKFEIGLKIIFPELAELSLFLKSDGQELYLNSIRVKPNYRGQGVGKRVMDKIIQFADQNGYYVTLFPNPDKGYKEKLQKFYKMFGFFPNRGKKGISHFGGAFGVYLIRPPKSKQTDK